MNSRRPLDLASPRAIMPEVDRLLRGGYRATGSWSLGQICHHLVDGITGSIEGFAGAAPWPIRLTIGRVARRLILARGRMPTGQKLPTAFQPRPDLDDRAEAEALRAAIGVLDRHAGPMAPHPLLGELTRDEWHRFHAVHAAHHLAFLLPDPPPAPARPD